MRAGWLHRPSSRSQGDDARPWPHSLLTHVFLVACPSGCPCHLRPPPQFQQGYDSRLQLQRLQRPPQLHRCAYPPQRRGSRRKGHRRARVGRRGVQGGDQEQDPKGSRLAQPRRHGATNGRSRSRHLLHCHHGPQQQDVNRVGPLERRSDCASISLLPPFFLGLPHKC